MSDPLESTPPDTSTVKDAVVNLSQESTLESFSPPNINPLTLSAALTEESYDSSVGNLLNPVPSNDDHESHALHLLRQIFPEESTQALRELHRQRVERHSNNIGTTTTGDAGTSTSPHSWSPPSNKTITTSLTSPPLSTRLFSPSKPLSPPLLTAQSPRPVSEYSPPSTTVGDDDDNDSRVQEWHAKVQRAWRDGGYSCLNSRNHDYSVMPSLQSHIVRRNEHGSLGLTLVQDPADGGIRIHAIKCSIELVVGDYLVGLQGRLFTPNTTLPEIVDLLRLVVDPIVLHIMPVATARTSRPVPALLDTTNLQDEEDEDDSFGLFNADAFLLQEPQQHITTGVFPSTPGQANVEDGAPTPSSVQLLATWRQARLIQNDTEQATTYELWRQYTYRTRQWEAFSFLSEQDLLVPLVGLRQALCVRLVHSFTITSGSSQPQQQQQQSDDDDPRHIAYTIWVYDTETGDEFYAPVRTWADFVDLRAAVIALQSSLRTLPFPQPRSSSALLFTSPGRRAVPPSLRTQQLEDFVRSLCAILYQGELHASVAEIAIHVQSFLGCDIDESQRPRRTISTSSEMDLMMVTRMRLKRSLQLYTYRLFLLPPLARKVAQFVEHVQAREPATPESRETLEASDQDRLKERAMGDLGQLKAFLDYLQDLVLDGCMEDLQSIAARDEYAAIHDQCKGSQGAVFWDRLVREAVREQVEIEVYVPLRSISSAWLVRGWRHDDMEAHFKIKELRKRSQNFFRLPAAIPTEEWMKASAILREGVGQSTLPCVKLHAIVDAAKAISEIFEQGRTISKGGEGDDKEVSPVNKLHLGADQFLPIFIFCVVRADIDRPCALCILLRSLCDRINNIGEIGYYLASFEAAVCHISEIDLEEEQGNQMRSFLSVNIT